MGKCFYSSTFRFGIAPKTNKSLPPAFLTPYFFLTSCLCQQKNLQKLKQSRKGNRCLRPVTEHQPMAIESMSHLIKKGENSTKCCFLEKPPSQLCSSIKPYSINLGLMQNIVYNRTEFQPIHMLSKFNLSQQTNTTELPPYSPPQMDRGETGG